MIDQQALRERLGDDLYTRIKTPTCVICGEVDERELYWYADESRERAAAHIACGEDAGLEPVGDGPI
jgi:hypothetical protein